MGINTKKEFRKGDSRFFSSIVFRDTEGDQRYQKLPGNKCQQRNKSDCACKTTARYKMYAIEINDTVAKICSQIPNVEVFREAVFDYPVVENAYDLTFTRGVMIHIAPERLEDVYDV